MARLIKKINGVSQKKNYKPVNANVRAQRNWLLVVVITELIVILTTIILRH